jgi:hypothetical protein
MMIGLRAQAGLLFVEADSEFTFSGDPTYLPRLLEVGYAIPTADQNLFLSWIEEQVALEIPPASSFA